MTYWGVLEEGVLAAGADYIVSGDKYLLDLKNYGNIKILNAAEIIELVGRRSGKVNAWE